MKEKIRQILDNYEQDICYGDNGEFVFFGVSDKDYDRVIDEIMKLIDNSDTEN